MARVVPSCEPGFHPVGVHVVAAGKQFRHNSILQDLIFGVRSLEPMPSSRCRMKWIFSLSGSKCTVSARFLHGFKTCKGCKSLQNRTKGAETRSSKPAMYRKEITLKRNFQKLRESPGVRYESVGRGFESLPSHQEKPEHVCVLVFLFVSTMEGARTGRRRTAPQAISPVQQRRPQPAAETGRSCWGRVLIFQSPAKGLRKNQLTQPVAVA